MEKKEIEQQEKNRRLVEREVYFCQSGLIDELLKKDFFSVEDIENYFVSFKQAKEWDIIDKNTKEEDYEAEAQEILEWWVVSEHLLEKLEAEGEPILKTDFGDWWGRTTSGQAILLDGVITTIQQKTKYMEK